MASEWAEVPLGEVITLQRGFDLPAQNRRPGKVPIVSSSGISDYHSEIGVKGPGVVTGRYGTIGQVFLIREDYWPLNTTLWVKDFHGNDPHFASYLLRTVDFRSCSDKSSVPGVNRNDLHQIRVLRPPLAEQKAIAAVLGALDDMIDLNRRMSATLEAIARTLFQSWFVDFDPVRAKIDGRKPAALDSATAALFPDSFGDSARGEIPKGWEMNRIDDVVDEVFDGPHATPPDSKYGAIFLGIKNLTGSALDLSEIRHISETDWPKWTKRVTPTHLDIVFSYEATLGFFALIPPGLRCCLGRRLALVRPKPKLGHPHFWFHQFIGFDFQRYLIQHSVQGATVDRIPLIHFPSYQVLDPPSCLKQEFEMRVAPLWANIHANSEQSRTLANLRDALLPKLLSGELDVSKIANAETHAPELCS